jgi:UDP-3-O-[3-hydroxymyristoyl] glucosamine N-acyltransferase
MKHHDSYTLAQLAESVGAKIKGDGSTLVTGLAPLSLAKPDQLSFLDNSKYRKYLKHTMAAGVLVTSEDAGECPVTALITSQPYLAFAKITHLLMPASSIQPGVHPTAVVSPKTTIDPSAVIGPYCVIAEGVTIAAHVVLGAHCTLAEEVTIGAGTVLYPHVVVYHRVSIGERVIIQGGAILGSDGFGFARDGKHWFKIIHLGGVHIGNDVEIGANTTVDRGALSDTVIEDGVKIDNQVQIAHNVHVGARTVIAGCTGVAGSTRIGKECVIGGGVCIAGHINIVDNVSITGMTMVTKAIQQSGVYSSGIPVQENSVWRKQTVQLRQLDKLIARVETCEKKMQDNEV